MGALGSAFVGGQSFAHDLRHCMGTVLAEAGVEQRLVPKLLGHSVSRISERYTEPRRPALRRAALKAVRLMGVERGSGISRSLSS